MKARILGLLLAAFVFAGPLSAVELHLATNQQILDELARRLNGGGGGGYGATADYTCQGSTILVSLVGSSTSSSHSADLRYDHVCLEWASDLRATRSNIERSKFAAFCQGSILHKMTMRTDGGLTVEKTEMRYDHVCLEDANRINR